MSSLYLISLTVSPNGLGQPTVQAVSAHACELVDWYVMSV